MVLTAQMLYPLEFIGFMIRMNFHKNMGGQLTRKLLGPIRTTLISRRVTKGMWVISPCAC